MEISLDQHVDTSYEELKTILNGGELTMLNYVSACLSLMQVAARVPGIKGPQRKELVTRVFQRYRDEHPSSSEGLSFEFLSSMIDAFVSVDKKEVTINIKPKKCLFACLNSMQGSVQVEKDKNKK